MPVNRSSYRPILRATLLALVVLSHVGVAWLLLRRGPERPEPRPTERVTWLTLVAPPPPVTVPPGSPDAAPGPAPGRPPEPHPSPKTPKAATLRPRAARDPCTAPPDPKKPRKPDPACPGAAEPRLALPGGLHQDEFGNVTPEPSSVFANLPPETPAQIAAAAAAHFAALEDAFGPPYEAPGALGGPNPIGPFGPTEKGRIIQFLEDRLNARPLVPQSTLHPDP